MKRNFLLLILLVPLLSFISDPIVYIRSHDKIEKLLVFSPVSRISVLGKGRKHRVDSGLSAKAFHIVENQLQKIFPDSIGHKYFSPDSIQRVAIDIFVIKANNKLLNSTQVSHYKVPDSIIQIFSTANANFVFCISNTGFFRTYQNLTGSHMAGAAVGLVSEFGWNPIASGSTISCFILDLNKKNIIFFERETWEDRDPTDPDLINLQLTRVLNHCFL